MSLSDSMARLSEIGYSLYLDNDKIRFHYDRSGEPPEEARGLLSEIKAHKEEALTLSRSIAMEPEPLPLETPVEPSKDQVKEDQPEPGIPEPLFGGPIKGDQPEGQKVPTEGKAKKAKFAPVKIFSKLFHEEIWLVADQEEMEALVSRGIKEVIYMAWEIPVLKGKDKERLRALHLTKKVFPGSALA
jgi:hypothetical protein